MVDLLTALTQDPDRDVIEAAERTDFELLNSKRKAKQAASDNEEETDEARVAF